ncbi:hypothetical protein M432DRAFT_609202 [Thermoascus aurantiacus ATCC 26904]
MEKGNPPHPAAAATTADTTNFGHGRCNPPPTDREDLDHYLPPKAPGRLQDRCVPLPSLLHSTLRRQSSGPRACPQRQVTTLGGMCTCHHCCYFVESAPVMMFGDKWSQDGNKKKKDKANVKIWGENIYIYIDQEEDPYPLLSNKEKGNVTHFQGCLEQFSILFMYSNSSFFKKKIREGKENFSHMRRRIWIFFNLLYRFGPVGEGGCWDTGLRSGVAKQKAKIGG